ncbi:MAG: hypothetical protein M3N52_07265, partial [Actinomycetota bacterium]|nr:hypothetical protein [Actinomycetota bacterium]
MQHSARNQTVSRQRPGWSIAVRLPRWAAVRTVGLTLALTAALVPATTGPAAAALPGDRLVYTEGDTQSTELRVVNADGTGEQTLTGGTFDVEPAWSPDGSRVVFVRREGPADRIMVVAADGSGLRTLADGSGGVAWSPDGTMLAFVRQAREGADPA